jgi:hypothetical protein
MVGRRSQPSERRRLHRMRPRPESPGRAPVPTAPWSRKDRILAVLVPALLATIACVQIARVHTLDQSPWSGAGFGMFATIDGETTRSIHGVVVSGDETTEAALPENLRRSAFELAVVPTESATDELAERWAEELDLPDDAHLVVSVRSVDIDQDLRLTTDVIVEGTS